MKRIDYILLGLCSMVFTLLLTTSCFSSDHDEDVDESAVLNIYVYAPENPLATRVDDPAPDPVLDPVPAEAEENAIHQLQIWVFRRTTTEEPTNELIGYIQKTDAADLPSGEHPMIYQIDLSNLKDFVREAPNVDVYVVANATAVGLTGLNEHTSRETLEAAMIQSSVEPSVDYFGLTSPVTSVPVEGLPMSGVLRNHALTGSAPIFSVGNVTLKRAVSRVRFVAGAKTGATLKITGITINEGMIPTQEYLFLGTTGTYHLPDAVTYNAEAALTPRDITFKDPQPNEEYPYPSLTVVESPTYNRPTAYLFRDQVKYEEEVIGEGLELKHIAEVGRCYLRETDKKIIGTISYTLNGEAKTPVGFEMYKAGEFSRNHSWVVYAYYAGGDNLEVQAVFVKDWNTLNPTDRTIYNW